jgi:23S rRNA pseudouridine2605 synthase
VLELPSTGWLRRYRVRAFGTVTQAQLDSLKEGVTIDGISYGSVEATIDTVKGSNVWLVVGLREGKNREVKRILQHLGLTVNRLIRVSFGPFQLADLGEGEIREIRGKVLRDQLGQRLVDESGADFDAPIIHHIAGAENEGAKPTKSGTKDEPKPKIGRSKLEFIGTDEDGSRRARIDREGRPSVAVKILPKRETSRSGPARSRPQRGGADEVTREERGAKPFRSEGFRDRGPGQGPARGRDRGADGEGGGRNWRSEGAREHGATSAPRRPRREASEATTGDEARAPRGRKPFGDKPLGDRPVRGGERSERPAGRSGDRSDRPVRNADRSDRPARGGDQTERPARSRAADGEGKRGPVKSGDREARPARTGDRSDRPVRSGDRADRPARGGKPGGPGKPGGGGPRGPRGGRDGGGNGADRRR